MVEYTLHNHTYLCKHAIGSSSEMVKEAVKAGFKTIGISDHVPFPITETRYKMEFDQKDEYIDELKKLKKEYSDTTNLLIGFEAEYQEEYENILISFFKEDNIDYLILGQHHKDVNIPSSYYGGYIQEQDIIDYVDQCIAGMKTGMFLYLAHPDLFMYKLDDFEEVCYRESIRLIDAAIKYDVYLEYNAGGIRKGIYSGLEFKKYQYPRFEFWQLVAIKQAKVVIGSDAHAPLEIADKAFNMAIEQAKQLELNYFKTIDLTSYDKRIERYKKNPL